MIFCFLPCPREWALSLVAITTTPFSFLPFLLLFYCEIEFSVGGKEEEKMYLEICVFVGSTLKNW